MLDFNSHSALYHKKSKSIGDMRKKTKTWNKIKEPFKELGIELEKINNLYEFEYNQTQMFLYVEEEEEMIIFTAFVTGVEKREDKEKLEMALDIVNNPHCVYSASWNNGDAIFASSFYSLKNKKQVIAQRIRNSLN